MKNHPATLSAVLVTALLFGGSASGALAQSHGSNHENQHQVCKTVRVNDKPSDSHQIAGTAIGAVAGGLLGNQVGGGKGKTLATVGGAVAGGYAGNKVQEHHQDSNESHHSEKRCHWVNGDN